MKPYPLLALFAFSVATFSAGAHADTLLIERVQQKPATAQPARGQTMSQVEAQFGQPQQKLDPRGGQRHQWPTINRWVYPNYTVYFEKNRVINVVARQAAPTETGPKPVPARNTNAR